MSSSFVSTFIHIIKTTICYSFHISSLIGQLIVNFVKLIYSCTFALLQLLYTITTIIFEDFGTFLYDIHQRVDRLVGGLTQTVDIVGSRLAAFLAVLDYFNHIILLIITTLINGIAGTINGIRCAFLFAKQLLILIGDGVWFALSIVPLSIMYCLQTALSCVDGITNALKTKLQQICSVPVDVANFVLDVPFESITGLFIGFCLVYIFVQVYFLMADYFRRKITIIRRIVAQNCRLLMRRLMIVKFVGGFGTLKSRMTVMNDEKPILPDNRVCVVCQENLKCILTLPCRHVCMCCECHLKVKRYGWRCPVCRNRIEQSMKVFV